MRPDVRASWDRARHHGLHPDRHLPEVRLSTAELRSGPRDRRLVAAWPVVFASLEAAATEPGHVLFGGDAEGHLLWVHGDPPARRTAERANLVPGARWHETEAGTNGVGTALALGRAFQVRGPEHYLSVAADFTCTAAPIRDPRSGAVIGVVDVTCRTSNTNKLAMPLVTAAARLAEAHLRELAGRRDAELRTRYLDRVLQRSGDLGALISPDGQVLYAAPPGWLPSVWPGPVRDGEMVLPGGRRVVVERLAPDGPYAVHALSEDATEQVPQVVALGRNRVALWMDGVVHELSPRHSELLVLMLARPTGSTAADLAEGLYGDNGKTVTVRAELARLRRILGYRLASDPYRLNPRIYCELLAAVCDNGSAEPSRGGTEMLAGSTAPGIQRLRQRIHLRAPGPDRTHRPAEPNSTAHPSAIPQ
ncbi:helix-turn-helix domain-containing protein [Nocardia testacea]|uniref:helix-turn-helix domain-containing protein n=1 Tax=Nocardia testacea TaxID=248551 RepID=UPI00030817E6|nr:helix-turn-helix domain-containing protein [Nocardia testacea]